MLYDSRSIGGGRNQSATTLPLCSFAYNECIRPKQRPSNSTDILRKERILTAMELCSCSCTRQSKQAIPTSWEQVPDQLGIHLMTRERRLRYALDR